MKKLILILLFPVLSGIIFQSCTKDRVPNPDTINVPQSVLYTQSFDSSLNLPRGWSVGGGSGGWAVDSTGANSSTGYPGASGLYQISISNPTITAGEFTVTSAPVSTVGYNNIGIIYGVRNTKNFPSAGSSMSLSWSSDDGHTWTPLNYQENAANSVWSLINGGTISLPATAANQPAVRFKWTANLQVTASGTYRFDDVQVFGSK